LDRDQGTSGDRESPLLDGVRVVEFSQLLAAPLCGLTLSDLGADVVKVEPRSGDETRRFPPFFEDGESAWFHAVNRGKRSVALSLGDPSAAEVVLRLVDEADVVVENLGQARSQLGVDYEQARARNPKLVWCAISGLGADRGGRAVDPSLQAEIGLMATTGEPDGPPVRIQPPMIDFTTGMYAAQQVLTALWRVERGGAGAFLDCALFDAAASLTGTLALLALGTDMSVGRLGSASYLVAPSAAFEASDGRHVMLLALTEEHWRVMCDVLGHPEWTDDPRCADNAARLANRELIHGWIGEVIATDAADHWVSAISAAGAICSPVRELADAWSDPRLTERSLQARLDRSGVDDFPVPVLSFARPVGDTPLPAGPLLGQHTEEVLRELGIRRG
jgi:crotonobetainyl-CoA:carnitine CoA-transferase CaiB-like acyl-CoA transferase